MDNKFFDEDDMTDEFTTAEVRGMAEDADAEDKRAVTGRRQRGTDVDNLKRAQRGHQSSGQIAKGSQKAKREHPTAWLPAGNLDAPPSPPGMVLRWVRDRIGQVEDPKNFSKKFRQGWTPYLLKDAPEEYMPPETGKSSQGDTIRVGDLVLCMMPRERYKARQKFYREKTARQTVAVRNKFRASEDTRLGPIEREYRESTSGRQPRVQADE